MTQSWPTLRQNSGKKKVVNFCRDGPLSGTYITSQTRSSLKPNVTLLSSRLWTNISIGQTGATSASNPIATSGSVHVVFETDTAAFRRVRQVTKSDYWLPHVCPSVFPSSCNNSAPTGQIFMQLRIWVCFENLLRKFKFQWNPTRITGTLHEYLYTFITVSRLVLLKIRNVSDKSVEKFKTYILYSLTFFPEKLVVYEKMWKSLYSRTGHIWVHNTAHALCMLDN